MKCLSEFGCNPIFEEVAMDAIRLIRDCAKYVAQHKERFHQLDMSSETSTSSLDGVQTGKNFANVRKCYFIFWPLVLPIHAKIIANATLFKKFQKKRFAKSDNSVKIHYFLIPFIN